MNIHLYSSTIDRSTVTSWVQVFLDGGYYQVESPATLYNWSAMHKWLKDNVGEQNYTWAGSHFFFEKEEDAVYFALSW